jgi:pimeloyl-ACP methyl ester carboxylesterase
VLVHGIGSSWGAWKPVLPALEAHHEVLALDLPGFGRSPPLAPGVAPTVAALTDAVEREIEVAGFERPHLAGNSLGGWIALELARRGRARTAVALSPAGMWSPRERAYSRAVLRALYATARRAAPHAEALTRSAAARTAVFCLVSSRPWRIDAGEAAEALKALGGTDAFLETLDHSIYGQASGLDQIEAPVLVAWGSRDRLLLPRQGPRCARAIPGAELRMLPGAGHVPMWDDEDLVADTILGFTGRAS